MPLVKSPSDKAFKSNIKKEMAAGKPQKQALAIAYATKRKSQKKSQGGMLSPGEGREAMIKASQGGELQVMGDGHGKDMNMPHSREECPDPRNHPSHAHSEKDHHDAQYTDGGEVKAAEHEMHDIEEVHERDSHRDMLAHGGQLPEVIHESLEKEGRDEVAEHMEVNALHKRDQKLAQYAEGGAVDDIHSLRSKPVEMSEPSQNEEEHPELENVDDAGHDYGMMSQEASARLHGRTRPSTEERISLADAVMADRQRWALGGKVAETSLSDEGAAHAMEVGQEDGIDAPSMSDLDNESGLMDATKLDHRPAATSDRGPNKEPVHYMDEPDHDSSEASIVAEILKDRKRRRRGE